MASSPFINVMRMPERAVSLSVKKSEIMPLTTGRAGMRGQSASS